MAGKAAHACRSGSPRGRRAGSPRRSRTGLGRAAAGGGQGSLGRLHYRPRQDPLLPFVRCRRVLDPARLRRSGSMADPRAGYAAGAKGSAAAFSAAGATAAAFGRRWGSSWFRGAGIVTAPWSMTGSFGIPGRRSGRRRRPSRSAAATRRRSTTVRNIGRVANLPQRVRDPGRRLGHRARRLGRRLRQGPPRDRRHPDDLPVHHELRATAPVPREPRPSTSRSTRSRATVSPP